MHWKILWLFQNRESSSLIIDIKLRVGDKWGGDEFLIDSGGDESAMNSGDSELLIGSDENEFSPLLRIN